MPRRIRGVHAAAAELVEERLPGEVLPPAEGDVVDAPRPGAEEFLTEYVELIRTMVEGYLREGKRFMTVAIGCTGGRHRSVAAAVEMAERLTAAGLSPNVRHRDLRSTPNDRIEEQA